MVEQWSPKSLSGFESCYPQLWAYGGVVNAVVAKLLGFPAGVRIPLCPN